MRYWYRTDNGQLKREVTHEAWAGHSGYAQTPDLADLPGPLFVCRWDGTQVVVDAARLAEAKAMLRERIERKALLETQAGTLTTPWGDFTVRREDLDAYLLIGFTAIYAIQTSSPFSMSLRRADDSSVTVTAVQFVRFLALVGERMAAKLGTRDARLDALAVATADQLKGFEP